MRRQRVLMGVAAALALVAGACSSDDGTTAPAPAPAPAPGPAEPAAPTIDYPTRQITIIVPFGAGGGVDINARALAPFLSGQLGVNVVVENRTGAGGITGHTLGATADPDGYTLTFVSPGIIGGPLTTADVLFEPTGFAFIGQVTEVPNFVTVAAGSPWQSAKDLVAEAQTRTLVTGRQSSFTSKSIALELFMFEAGIKANVTTGWAGGAELLTALITGDVEFSMHDTNELVGREDVRALCASSATRSPDFPDVPTCAEEGFTRVQQGVWRGLAAPVGTPDEIVQILSDALVAALDTTELKGTFELLALSIDYLDGAGFEARVLAETETLREVFGELGVLVP